MGLIEVARNLGMQHNVTIRVLDAATHDVVSQHVGHNSATNSMLTGIGNYLIGNGIWNQGYTMLGKYVPQYISLGTMGLINQDADISGYPAGIGVISYADRKYAELSEADLKVLNKPASDELISAEDDEILRFVDYLEQRPGFGADGYDHNSNNNRLHFGLGPIFADRADKATTIDCELISSSFPRSSISFREVVPEIEAEVGETVDVVFSALVSVGALAEFRAPGDDYIFITEAGLWASQDWNDSGANGLLAGYRIAPPSQANWDMRIAANRDILRRNIIRVNKNQVVQVVWKIQLGSIDQLVGINNIYPDQVKKYWIELGGRS